jgi:hypothetical protein
MKLQHTCYHKYSSRIKHVYEHETNWQKSKINHNFRTRSMRWEARSSWSWTLLAAHIHTTTCSQLQHRLWIISWPRFSRAITPDDVGDTYCQHYAYCQNAWLLTFHGVDYTYCQNGGQRVLIKNRGHNFCWVGHLVQSIICGNNDDGS